MVSVKIKLNKCRKKNDGTYPLVFQLIYKRKKRLIYSPYYLLEENFDTKNGCVRRSGRVNAYNINHYINNTANKINTTIECLKEQGDFQVEDIVSSFRRRQDYSIVSSYFLLQIQLLHEQERFGTANSYRSTYFHFNRFSKNDGDVTFTQITSAWVNKFIFYLNGLGLKENSVNLYLRILRAVYNRAYKEEIHGTVALSPFRRISLKNSRTLKKAINKATLLKIILHDFTGLPDMEFARDLFLFSFYCRGMPFVDMAFLKYRNIENQYICYCRKKTKQPLKIRIIGPLNELISKYKNKGEYVLPILSESDASLYNQYRKKLRVYNAILKEISQLLDLKIKLSSYVARHTWATQARENGIPVAIISEGMGHSSEKVTYSYLASLAPSHIDAANRKVIKSCIPKNSEL